MTVWLVLLGWWISAERQARARARVRARDGRDWSARLWRDRPTADDALAYGATIDKAIDAMVADTQAARELRGVRATFDLGPDVPLLQPFSVPNLTLEPLDLTPPHMARPVTSADLQWTPDEQLAALRQHYESELDKANSALSIARDIVVELDDRLGDLRLDLGFSLEHEEAWRAAGYDLHDLMTELGLEPQTVMHVDAAQAQRPEVPVEAMILGATQMYVVDDDSPRVATGTPLVRHASGAWVIASDLERHAQDPRWPLRTVDPVSLVIIGTIPTPAVDKPAKAQRA